MAALILASQSPRRKELLGHLGYPFAAVSPEVDESVHPGEAPSDYVLRLAVDKARSGEQMSAGDYWLLGSDTAVVIDDQVLGKPENAQQAIAMLQRLSARKHKVFTAIALLKGDLLFTDVVVTEVDFKALTLCEIQAYWQTGEPADKAGSYGIQGIGGKFVKGIKGSFSAVVGLPLYETEQLLIKAGLPKG
jgi:septum formation protein